MATDNLTLNGSAALLDATYKKYQNAQCPIGPDGNREDPSCIDGQGDLSGRRLERAPEVELNLGGAWEGQVSQNLFLTANVDMYYSGDFYVRQDFDPDGRQDAFTKWNARFGLGPQDGGWEVALVGRNLTDERTIQHAYEVLSPFQAVGAGRSVFLETTFRW
jgi:iron complex outermembrane receptor protein